MTNLLSTHLVQNSHIQLFNEASKFVKVNEDITIQLFDVPSRSREDITLFV